MVTELDEVLTEIRTLRAECEMLLRITAAVDDLELDREFPDISGAGPAGIDGSVYLH